MQFQNLSCWIYAAHGSRRHCSASRLGPPRALKLSLSINAGWLRTPGRHGRHLWRTGPGCLRSRYSEPQVHRRTAGVDVSHLPSDPHLLALSEPGSRRAACTCACSALLGRELGRWAASVQGLQLAQWSIAAGDQGLSSVPCSVVSLVPSSGPGIQ